MKTLTRNTKNLNTLLMQLLVLMIWESSHVLAMRKGRLMCPSTFTSLSGDLHVQVQFSANDSDDGKTLRSEQKTFSDDHLNTSIVEVNSTENIITNTLVISKFIDEDILEEGRPVWKVNNSLQKLPRKVQLSRKEVVQNIPFYPDPRRNVTQVSVPCKTFLHGGFYEIQVVSNIKKTMLLGFQKNPHQNVTPSITTTTLMPSLDERLRQTLEVKWPRGELIVSTDRLLTYPKAPVEVIIRYPEANCKQILPSEELPQFWLELVYCGKESHCDELLPQNVSKSNVLYAEQVQGFPIQRTMQLRCELFGLAGNYAVQLRPMKSIPFMTTMRHLITVDWSDEFVFNVYASSIFPCDPHTGIGVLYEYPGCILEQGDRVRLYAKLRADVGSIKPPTSLHYIAEQRVIKSQFSLYFNCELFSEKYVEYCFVYVSQAISGAVADVRMDCVPTLPVRDSDTGGWGVWSDWTPCSTNCGGTRNRYRFCDSPPPRYGAQFCVGAFVETENCGKNISDAWDCLYGKSGFYNNKPNGTDISHEIGPGCRCGCIVHLGSTKPKRIIAGATQSCPGRSFWLIQVDNEDSVVLSFNFLRLPCSTQYLKVRDGPSLSSTLLFEFNSDFKNAGGADSDGIHSTFPLTIESKRSQLLVEFFAGDENISSDKTTHSAAGSGLSCAGGFIANIEYIMTNNSSSVKLMAATRFLVKTRAMLQKTTYRARFTVVHLSAMVFVSVIILISALVGAQYVLRYRKYHLAMSRIQKDGSRLHTPRISISSLHNPPSRAISTTTLLSEVIYLVKMRPKHRLRHSVLRESVDADTLAHETEFNEKEISEKILNCKEDLRFGRSRSTLTLHNEHPPTSSLDTSPASNESEEVATETLETKRHCQPLGYKDINEDANLAISPGMRSLCSSPQINHQRLSNSSETRLSSLKLGRIGWRSISALLTTGNYSPAASVVSIATIRTNNPKESKEQLNRKKMLARQNSEFSLGNQEDLELDYYDYNVINAGAAPGSYLGMDPAYLIWVPPFEEVAEREDDDKTPEPACMQLDREETVPSHEYNEMSKYGHFLSTSCKPESSKSSTSSNTPNSEDTFPIKNNTSQSDLNKRNCIIQKGIAKMDTTKNPKHTAQSKSTESFNTRLPDSSSSECADRVEKLALEITSSEVIGQSYLNVSMNESYIEKETAVEKSTENIKFSLILDDIQFADESGSDYEVTTLKQDQKKPHHVVSSDPKSNELVV